MEKSSGPTPLLSDMLPLRQLLADFVFPEGAERRNRAEREANTDELTGVANARALARALPSIEADPELAIIFIDGNDFGLVNKIAGHEAGDQIIKQVAEAALVHSSRVFRRGGDEFVVAVPLVRAVATRQAIEDMFGVVVHNKLRITITGGLGQTFWRAEADLKRRKATRKAIWKNQI